MQDINLQPRLIETRETVTVLENQVEQLTTLVQDTVLQRLTNLEVKLMGESAA